jgi:hypothetical protein
LVLSLTTDYPYTLTMQVLSRGTVPLKWIPLAHLLLHASERVVGSRQVARQVGKGLLHQALHLNPLIPGK